MRHTLKEGSEKEETASTSKKIQACFGEKGVKTSTGDVAKKHGNANHKGAVGGILGGGRGVREG